MRNFSIAYSIIVVGLLLMIFTCKGCPQTLQHHPKNMPTLASCRAHIQDSSSWLSQDAAIHLSYANTSGISKKDRASKMRLVGTLLYDAREIIKQADNICRNAALMKDLDITVAAARYDVTKRREYEAETADIQATILKALSEARGK